MESYTSVKGAIELPEATIDLAPQVPLERLRRHPLSLAVGMFDGVHRGHQAVIRGALEKAKLQGGVPGVLTFWPHPSRLFRPEEPTRMLQPVEQKRERLFRAGMQLIIWKAFTRHFAAVPAEDFIRLLQESMPGLKSLHVGSNFRFGRGRQGDAEQLTELGRQSGVEVVITPRLQHEEEPISSSRIRECLEQGRMDLVNQLLGYTYRSRGKLQPGRRLGRMIGFPTLNLAWDPELPPRRGVYVVGIRRPGEDAWRPGIANYGIRPTVEKGPVAAIVEVYILDRDDVAYEEGEELELAWHHFIRGERKFEGLDALQQQIALDCDTARAWWQQQG
ncbi:MAG: riboflavin kinase / FMN adenylyltransferase [Puniceicoccaceae bacterium 5H]|nr:MAG: riboflavin kinase / FMN adenylyltransferase [Puniceicoccaceae bacterium 5H]